jgi:hypothetical protein
MLSAVNLQYNFVWFMTKVRYMMPIFRRRTISTYSMLVSSYSALSSSKLLSLTDFKRNRKVYLKSSVAAGMDSEYSVEPTATVRSQ